MFVNDEDILDRVTDILQLSMPNWQPGQLTVGVIKQTEDRRMGIQEGGNVGSVNAGGLETGGRHLIAG